ncbi:hypothetical protein FHT44_006186 [Mycolicibacterium sp. BK634]|uniref:hypothetical protein n=1 Tax=Mycolicibacterium sp. BK634 TaxID=2587099 RepID=UPI00161614F5|nr:hypothetical protein [Mycolicibacterium sp. BK634]MBB3753664.1 hypothetical protein [Mycolicibacterium sp. BK634]
MPHYTVLVGGKTVYRGEKQPKEHADGRLELPSGQTFAKGAYRLVEHKGNPPPISGKGSVPQKPGRPEKLNPAGGFSDSNTK